MRVSQTTLHRMCVSQTTLHRRETTNCRNQLSINLWTPQVVTTLAGLCCHSSRPTRRMQTHLPTETLFTHPPLRKQFRRRRVVLSLRWVLRFIGGNCFHRRFEIRKCKICGSMRHHLPQKLPRVRQMCPRQGWEEALLFLFH